MNWRYVASAATGLAECLLIAGLIFGWPSISFALHSLHYFCFPPPNSASSSVSPNSSISISQTTFTSSQSQTTFTLFPSPSSSSSSIYFQTTSPFLSLPTFSTSSFASPAPSTCPDQDRSLSLAFSIATFAMSFSTLPCGWLLDTYGTWVARAVALVLYCGGAALIACSSPGVSELVYPGTIGIAVGGIMMLITNFQDILPEGFWLVQVCFGKIHHSDNPSLQSSIKLSLAATSREVGYSAMGLKHPDDIAYGGHRKIKVANLFPRYRATFITAYNGAFDSSASMAVIIKFLWQAGIPLQICFAAISLAFPLLAIRSLILLPRHHIPLPAPPRYRYGLSLLFFKHDLHEEAEEGQAQAPLETQQAPSPTGSGEASLWTCIRSRLFLSHFVWLSILQCRHYLYISTLNPWLSTLSAGDMDKISWYTTLFAIIQSCAWFCAPWNGRLIDLHRQRLLKGRKDVQFAGLGSTIPSLGLTTLLGIAFAGVAAIPKIQAQGLAFCLQVMSRAFLYGGNAAFIAIAFPSAHFGKLFGLMMSASAIPLLLQLPLVSVSQEHPHMVNGVTFALCLLTLIHPVVVDRHYRKLSNSHANSHADEDIFECKSHDV
uniref:equilibrative nucleobase transporter 1 isoform X1 n=1 Tax=Myxine glutinosa TaxID=7769 RepID=UPI00358DFD07